MTNKNNFPEYTPNPVFNGLPEYLKDPQHYDKIMRSLLETLATTCSHGDPSEMAKCHKCTQNMLERRALMNKLGFKSSAQFMAWRKVMETILGRTKKPEKTNKYNKKVTENGYEMLDEVEISKLELPEDEQKGN